MIVGNGLGCSDCYGTKKDFGIGSLGLAPTYVNGIPGCPSGYLFDGSNCYVSDVTPQQLQNAQLIQANVAVGTSAAEAKRFVDAEYLKVLNRAYDPAGEAGWISALVTGQMTEAQVDDAFYHSAEYIAQHASANIPNDSLIRNPVTGDISIYYGGKRYHVNSPAWIGFKQYAPSVDIDANAFNAIPFSGIALDDNTLPFWRLAAPTPPPQASSTPVAPQPTSDSVTSSITQTIRDAVPASVSNVLSKDVFGFPIWMAGAGALGLLFLFSKGSDA